MATVSRNGGNGGANQASLGHHHSIESELVQRNREIAKVRDLLRQREHEINDWKSRHSELVGRLAEADGEVTKAKARFADLENELTKSKARHQNDSLVSAADAVAEASARSAQEAEHKHEVVKLVAEHNIQVELLHNEAKAALEAKDDALREVAEVRRERNRAVETASRRTSEHDLEVARLSAELAAAKSEISRLADQVEEGSEFVAAKTNVSLLTKQLEEARSETVDALQQANDARADLANWHSQREQDLHAHVEATRIASNRAEDLEERLATERHGVASQLRALEEQLSCERRARREAEEGRIVMATDLKEAMDGLTAATAQLATSESASLVRSKEMERLRMEGCRLADRIVGLEDQLRSSSQYESRARALHTECSGLRSEVKLLRRQCQELHEGFAMVAEETRTQKIEAAGENAKLRLQLEETRRARTLEMRALVTKMCAVGATGGTKEEA